VNSILLMIAVVMPNDAESDARAALALAAAAEEPAVQSAVVHNYRWVRGTKPGRIYLFDGPAAPNGVQIGMWVYSPYGDYGEYYPWHDDHNSWGFPLPYGQLPKGVPEPPARAKPQAQVVLPSYNRVIRSC
jgi:hypothetical protein